MWWIDSKMGPDDPYQLIFTPLYAPLPWVWAGPRLAPNQWNVAKVMRWHSIKCNFCLASKLSPSMALMEQDAILWVTLWGDPPWQLSVDSGQQPGKNWNPQPNSPKEMNPVNDLMSSEVRSSPVRPLDGTPALADALIAASWEILKQKTQLSHVQNLDSHKLEVITVCCFKSLSLWCYIVVHNWYKRPLMFQVPGTHQWTRQTILCLHGYPF